MAGEKRTKAQKLNDRQRIARLRLFSKTQQEIADELGLSQPTVARELKIIESEWQESARADIDAIKARELAQLELLEAEVMEQWERSKKDYEKRVVEDKPPGARGGGGKSAKIERGGQCGDPRYIQAMVSIKDRKAKLLGIDKPAKTALTDPDGNELPQGPVIVALPAQLDAEAWAQAFSRKPG